MAESLYPQILDKFDRKRNETGAQDGDYVMAEDVNELQSAIEKMQSTLGVNPQGGYSSIAQKLNAMGTTEVMTIPSITFYRGNPLYANGITSSNQLTKAFGWFNHVILEDYDVSNSTDTQQVKEMIEKTYSQEGTMFYLPISASRSMDLDLVSVERKIIEAKEKIGILGVYLYDLGYDQNNTRENQNEIINLIKKYDMKIMASASDLLDLSNSKIHFMNPNQDSISLGKDDIVIDNDFGKSQYIYHSPSHINSRHEAVVKLKKELGCKIFASSNLQFSTNEELAQDYFFLNSLAMIMSVDAFGINKSLRLANELEPYPKIPLSIGYFDVNAEIQKRGNKWERYDDFGRLEVNIETHKFDYAGVKIPLSFIEFGKEKIKWDNIDLTNMDFDYKGEKIVAAVNDMGNHLEKIQGRRVDYNSVGYDLIQSLNRYPDLVNPGETIVKISSEIIDGLSMEDIMGNVKKHFKDLFGEMLLEYLQNGWLDANFNNIFANFIEATNAYFENVMAGNIETGGLNAGLITTGKFNGSLVETGTISGDKVTFINSLGLNKWLGVLVSHDLTGVPRESDMKPSIINGHKNVRKLEALDSSVISTTDNAGSLENYVVVWETNVLTHEAYQTNIHFSATDKAYLYVNNEAVIDANGKPVTSQNMIATPYTLKFVKGWNKIQIVQSHTKDTNVMFNLGICLSEEALKNETKPNSSPVLRVDGYADKSTSISGDVLETGSVTAKQIDTENLTAEIVKTDLLDAIEAHIKHIIAEDGEFESLLSDLLKAQTIDTSNIRIISEAADENGDYGILLVDNGGMTVSSAPRAIKPEPPAVPNWELLTKATEDTWSGSHKDWVYLSKDKYAKVKLMDQFNNEVVLDIEYYTVDYINGKIKIDSRKLMQDKEIDIAVYNRVYGNYYWYDLEFPQDAQVVKVNRNGVMVSGDGGRTFRSKLTGNGLIVENIDITNQAVTGDKIANLAIENAHIKNATIESSKIKTMDAGKITFGMLDLETVDPETGETVKIATSGKCVTIDKHGIIAMDDNLNPKDLVKLDQGGLLISEDGGNTWKSKLTGTGLVVENAEIESIEAGKITTGNLNADTSITVASKVFIDGKEGIILKDSNGNQKILINENINISEGKLSVSDKGTERIVLGNMGSAYGLKLFTDGSYIVLDKDGLRTSNGNFNIDKSGNVILKGRVEANSGYFGTEANKILVDDKGLAIGSGSIVDTRVEAEQKLKIDSEGIVAKAGKIGSVKITDTGLETNGTIIGPEIEVNGEENIKLKEGSIAISKNGETLMAFGNLGKHLGVGYYGIYTDLYDESSKTGATITWNQYGLMAKQGEETVFSINDKGTLYLKGDISATSGYLENLDIKGMLTIRPTGSIKAGETILNSNGIIAKQGNIGGWTINNENISSGSLVLNGAGEITAPGFTLNSNGVKAVVGNIGGWILSDNALTSGDISIDSSTQKISIKDEILIGKISDTNYGLKAGTVILNKNGITGTDFSLDSNGMFSTKGNVGGWIISSGKLTSGNINLDSENDKINIGSLIELNNNGSAKFGDIFFNKTVEYVSYNMYTPNFNIDNAGNVSIRGKVDATSGTFRGRLEASEGWFGSSERGVLINQYGLSAGNVSINSNGIALTTQSGSILLNNQGLLINENGDTFSTSINLNNKFIADKSGIKAVAGKIASWNISQTSLTSGSISLDSSEEKLKIGEDIVIGKIPVNETTNEYAIKVGTHTKLNSEGISTIKGSIGEWNIDSKGLSNGTVSIKPNAISLGTNIVLNANGSAKLGTFNVKSNGDIFSGESEATAKFKVLLDGSIEAKKGTMGGWSISDTQLSGQAIRMLPSGAISLGANNELVLDSLLGIDVGLGTTRIDLQGNINTQSLIAKGGKIANWLITEGRLRSSNELIDLDSNEGALIAKDSNSNEVARLGKFIHNENESYGLWAQNGVIAGWLVSENGFSVPGITMESSPIPQIKINETVFLRGDGNITLNAQTNFKPDGSSKLGQLLIGADGSIQNENGSLIIDASGNLRIVGEVTAARGNIGGWLISDSKLSAGNIQLVSSGVNSSILISSNIALRNNGTAKLGSLNVLTNGLEMVDAKGNKALTFDNASGNLSLTGSINTASGNIGGWIVDKDSITSPNISEQGVIKLYAGATSTLFIGGTTEELAPIYFRNDGIGKIGVLELNKVVDNVNYTLHSENFKIDNQGNGYFNGSVYTNQGEVAGWKVSGSKIYVNSSIADDKSELGLDALEKRFYITDSTGGLILTVDGDDGINIRDNFVVDVNGNLRSKTGSFGNSATEGVRVTQTGLEVFGENGKIISGEATLDRNGLTVNGVNSSIQLGPNAEFKVTGAGVLTAKSGTIAGWNISNDRLSSSGIAFKSTGEIVLGNNDLVLNSSTGLSTTKTKIDLAGKITTAQIEADGGIVGGWNIQEGSLSSPNIVIDSTNEQILVGENILNGDSSGKLGSLNIAKDGTISSLNNSFIINGTTGSATFNGEITSNAGTIAGWKITQNELVDSLGKIALNPTTGIKVGGKFSVDLIGNLKAFAGKFGSELKYVEISEDGLDITTGKIKAGDVELSKLGLRSGLVVIDNLGLTAPGFTLDKNGLSLTQGSIILPGVTLGTNGLSMTTGNINLGNGNFTATNDGRVVAINGLIGGWALSNNKLTAGTITLSSVQGSESITIGSNVAFRQDGSANIGVISVSSNGTITSKNNSFSIDGLSGNATFNGRITSAEGTIGGWTIGLDKLESSNISLSSTGNITIGGELTDKIIIDSEVGILTDNTSIDLDGTIATSNIVATGGKIAKWNIIDGKLSSGNITIDGTTDSESITIGTNIGFRNDGSAKIGSLNVMANGSISSANNKFNIATDGSVSVDGSITSSTGTIGGWVLGNGLLTAGNITLVSTPSKEKISIGNNISLNNDGSAKLGNVLVSANGNVSLTGNITSASGNIGGWNIAQESLTSGSIGIYSGVNARIDIASNIVLRQDGTAKIGSLNVSSTGSITSKNNKLVIDGETGILTIDGTIKSVSGSIGGWSIANGGLTATGIKILSGAYPSIQVGETMILNAAGNAKLGILTLGIDGSIRSNGDKFIIDKDGNVTIQGSMNAALGQVGGWTISSNSISSSGIVLTSGDTSNITIGDAIALRNNGTAKLGLLNVLDNSINITAGLNKVFEVNDSGSASFSGNITTSGGLIAGWTIGASTLANGSTIVLDKTGKISLTSGLDSIVMDVAGTSKGLFVGDGFSVDMKGSIVAKNGWIGNSTNGVQITSTGLQVLGAGNIKAGGTTLSKDGISITQGSVNLGGNLTIDTTGSLTAIKGRIANWTIDSNVLKAGAITLDSTATKEKIAIGSNISLSETGSKIGALSIRQDGVIANNGSIVIDEHNVTINGKLTATSGSNIGGWIIASNSISNGGISLNSTAGSEEISIVNGLKNITLNPRQGINIGSNFSVTMDGLLTAKTGYLGTNTNGVQVGENGLTVIGTGSIKTSTLELVDKTFTVKNGSTVHLTVGEYLEDTTKYYGLKGSGFTLDSRGLNLSSIANINIANKFRVDTNGNLTASNVTLSGNITATSGTFNGTVNATAGKFGSSSRYVTVDENGLTLDTGRLKAGTVILDNNGLTGTGFTLGSEGLNITQGQIVLPGVTLSNSGLTMASGDINLGNGKFIASNSGRLTATFGTIGNWTIGNQNLQSVSGNINLDAENNKIEIYKNSVEKTKNKVVIEAGSVKIVNSNGLVSTAMDSAGIYGELLTDQSITGEKFDQIAPAKVTNVSIVSDIVIIPTGEEAVMNVTWDAVMLDADGKQCTDLVGYKVFLKDITRGDTEFYPVAIAYTNKYQIRGLRSNAEYEVIISAYDKVSNEGLASDVVRHKVVRDTKAPQRVVVERVSQGFKSLGVFWTPVMDYDIDYYEIERKEKSPMNSTWSPFVPINKTASTSLIDTDLDYNMQFSYRVRGVDLSGNKGEWSSETLEMQPSKVGKNDIVAGTITAEELNIGSVVKSINVQNTTLFHFDGTLMTTQGITPYTEILDDGTKVVHQSGFFKKEARFGASLSIEEDTDNLIAKATNANADFKSGTRGWTLDGAVFSEHGGVDGIDDGFITVGNARNNYCIIDVENSSKDEYYFISVYAKSLEDKMIKVDVQPVDGDATMWQSRHGEEFSNAVLENVIFQEASRDWYRYGDYFCVPANSGTTRLKVFISSYGEGATVDIDSVQVEKRRFMTSFVNGAKLQGYVDYDSNNIVNPEKGVISFWAYNGIGWHDKSPNTKGTTIDPLFLVGNPISNDDVDNNSIYGRYDRGTGEIGVKYGGVWTKAKLGDGIANKQWIHFAYTWKDKEQVLFVNGKEVDTTQTPVIGMFSGDGISGKILRIGYFPRFDGTRIVEEWENSPIPYNERANSFFDELRIDKTVVNTEEIKSWYLQESSFYDASAQIDADSQNISASNASVVINNEGITVRDGKIEVSSQGGNVLIKDGRLMVNGLDVGVAQSDNGIYNGNFTIEDSEYGTGDVKMTSAGPRQYAPKYWKTTRNKPQTYNQSLLALNANNINIEEVYGPDTLKEMCLLISRKEYAKNKLPLDYDFANNYYPWDETDCKEVMIPINKSITKFYDSLPVKTSSIRRIIEFIMVAIMRKYVVMNLEVAESKAMVDMMVDSLLTGNDGFNFTDLGVSSEQIPLYKTAIKEMISDCHYPVSYLTISNASYTYKYYYDRLINFNMGYMRQFDTKLNTIYPLQAYMVMSKDVIDNVYNPVYGPNGSAVVEDGEQVREYIEDGVYYVECDLINQVINGLTVKDFNVNELVAQLDKYTWLPQVNLTRKLVAIDGTITTIPNVPITKGGTGTYVHAAISDHYVGRQGFMELGIEGKEAATISIQQDVNRLSNYTDGEDESGTNFKQHSFSMAHIWEKDEKGNIKKCTKTNIRYEVEEFVGGYKIVNGETVKSPIIRFETNTEEYYEKFVQVPFFPPLQGPASRIDLWFFNMLLPNCGGDRELAMQVRSKLTHADKTIIHNTVIDPNAGMPVQTIGVTHMKKDARGHVVHFSMRNPQTMSLRDGSKYLHAPWRQWGIVYDGTAFFEYDKDGNIDKGPLVTHADGVVKHQYDPHFVVLNIKEFAQERGYKWTTDSNQSEWAMATLKKGDAIGFIMNHEYEFDMSVNAVMGPECASYNLQRTGRSLASNNLWSPTYSTVNLYKSNGEFGGETVYVYMNEGKVGPELEEVDSTQYSIMAFESIDVYAYENLKKHLSKHNKQDLIPQLNWANNVRLITDDNADAWNLTTIQPNISNSKINGVPILPSGVEIKYRVKVSLEKTEGECGSNMGYCKITALQAELGKNPSYHRLANGEKSISGQKLQDYQKNYWRTSGIKTRHLEEHVKGHYEETGIYSRHLADGAIISQKIASQAIKTDNLADANITYNKVRMNKTLLNTKKCDHYVIADWYYDGELGKVKELVNFDFALSKGDNIYYVPEPAEFNSEMLYENGQLLYGDDYKMEKILTTVDSREIIEFMDIIIEYLIEAGRENELPQSLHSITMKNVTSPTEGQIRDIAELMNRIDLYQEPVLSTKLTKLKHGLYYATRVILKLVPDEADKHIMTYWVES